MSAASAVPLSRGGHLLQGMTVKAVEVLGGVGRHAERFVETQGDRVVRVGSPFDAAATAVLRDLAQLAHEEAANAMLPARLGDVQLLQEEGAGNPRGWPKARVRREADEGFVIPRQQDGRGWTGLQDRTTTQ